jgi:hypothetical protein
MGKSLMKEMEPELREDSRWQLIERITASASFQKSAKLRDLLRFLAEKSLHGQPQDLTEHRIGEAVFGKEEDYSVVEDSSVRVHVRQLRLKLHEYFDGEGRAETWIVEIPKGAYTTLFRPAQPRASTTPVPVETGQQPKSRIRLLPWVLAALLLVTTLIAWLRQPWRLSSIRPTVLLRWWWRTSITA